MPARAARASDEAGVIAPDGIAIHTFELPPAAYVGVAEGRIPPGRYGIHRHLSLEQYTYVLAGRVTAVTGGEDAPDGVATELAAGDLLLTLPGESLQFINEGAETARVLFICAPPYPADNADTRTLDRHGPPNADEREEAIQRIESIGATFDATAQARIAVVRRPRDRQ